ncbi:hypothetical protein C6Y62_09620 [Hyphomicrobium sulfonivorans]|nr:hypothetical protein [Hyphomicrobium sulfonivorans]
MLRLTSSSPARCFQLLAIMVAAIACSLSSALAQSDPLPSWNDAASALGQRLPSATDCGD